MRLGPTAHALDDLFVGDRTVFAPLYRRAMFGKYAFKNNATLEAFAEAQRALYDTLDNAGRKRQRELLIKLCDTGCYPPLPACDPQSTSLNDLLTPAPDVKSIGSRAYRCFGKYLVQQEVVEDFLRAHEALARYEEEIVRGILSTLISGGAQGRSTRLIDNDDWNTAFILAPDHEGRYLIQWDRRMMLCDKAGAIVPSPLLLLHEEQHAADVLNDPVGALVLQATPSKEYGDHLEGNVISGIESTVLAAMGLPARDGFYAATVGALELTSTQISLSMARGDEPFQRVGEHETTGHIISLNNQEVAVRDAFGNIIRYELRELSNVIGVSLERTLQGKMTEPKKAEKRILNTMRILHDAGLHKDTITIGIQGNTPPMYANAQQVARTVTARGKSVPVAAAEHAR